MAKSSLPSFFETATNTYTSEGSIGEGGCGTVFRVHDPDREPYALKLLKKANRIKRKRFKHELAFCQNYPHRHIVKVVDYGTVKVEDETLPFYVMPLYQSSLRTLMKNGIPAEDVLKLFNDILNGVEAAHLQGVFHRDLKPENLLVELPGPHIVVADFGIAHFEEELLLTSVQTKAGDKLANYLYSAPEQRAEGVVDKRADIFALGRILNEMFTGEVPQSTGHTLIAAAAPDFAYLDPIIDRMIRQSPAERPGSIREIKAELHSHAAVFSSQQKLDQIRKIAVSITTPDDPLGGKQVIPVDFDYYPRHLRFRLEPPPPPLWIVELQKLQDPESILDVIDHTGPDTFRISANETNLVQVAKNVQAMVQRANQNYRERIAKDAFEEEARQRNLLAREVKSREERLRGVRALLEAGI
jgi:serine/threonine protein kinase